MQFSLRYDPRLCDWFHYQISKLVGLTCYMRNVDALNKLRATVAVRQMHDTCT